jgi:hypothetical protein
MDAGHTNKGSENTMTKGDLLAVELNGEILFKICESDEQKTITGKRFVRVRAGAMRLDGHHPSRIVILRTGEVSKFM